MKIIGQPNCKIQVKLFLKPRTTNKDKRTLNLLYHTIQKNIKKVVNQNKPTNQRKKNYPIEKSD